MALSAISNPPSVNSSPSLAPALPSIKPQQATRRAAISPVNGAPGILTHKKWVIPPRPKPGRKPATDTPPTKRKAQNRAAQRAFRERRAARVGELEEQIKKIEDDNERDTASLKQRIEHLSIQVEQCRNEISWWKKRCQTLEKDVVAEKSAKEALIREFSPKDGSKEQRDVARGCGNCSPMRCQCIDDAFNPSNVPDVQDEAQSSKRPHSPHGTETAKRHRFERKVKPEPEQLEIDFTSRFS